jgi:hypothetical protein
MYLKRDFRLYLKMPGNSTGRRWLNLDSEDRTVTSPQGFGMMRSFPNIIVSSNLLIIWFIR